MAERTDHEHGLYHGERIGFERYETNLYRIDL